MVEPMPTERQQKEKIDEIVKNINLLKEDIQELKEAWVEIQKGQKSIERLLDTFIKNV